MREVDDHVQLYVPVLRRIVVLVAVIIAVPVVLWSITAFVRTYVAPPKVPTFHSLAEQTFAEAAQSVAAQPGSVHSLASAPATQPKPPETPPVVEARATATDANVDAPKGAYLGDRTRGDAGAVADAPTGALPTAGTPAPAANSSPTSTGAVSPSPWPAAPDATTRTDTANAVPPSAAWPSATEDELPAAGPISGPVPLPRPRPRLFAMAPESMAQATGIPVPRDRPATAPDATATAPDAPFANLRDYNR